MIEYKTPMLIDIFRLTQSTDMATQKAIIDYLKSKAGGFNYNRSATFTEKAYGGYRNLDSLFSQCEGDGTSIAKVHNTKVLKATAPLSLGRNIQTFRFPKRKYTVAPGIKSSLGPQFFFVENGVVKLLYIHARNSHRADLKDFAGLAWALKQDVLDEDFFGQPSDIEFINVDKRGSVSTTEVYSLSDLEVHLMEDPQTTLGRFTRAFNNIKQSGLAGEIVRRRRPQAEYPHPDLFA